LGRQWARRQRQAAAAAGASWQISLAHSPPQCPQEITTKSSLSFDVAVKLKSLGGASGGASCDLLAFALSLSLLQVAAAASLR